MAALMMGFATACVTMTSCTTNDDNPADGDVPSVGQVTVKELNELKSSDVGWVIGADGKAYSSVWQAMGNHVETVAAITYIAVTPDEVRHFLAIAQREEKYTETWEEGKAAIAAMAPIAGCEWRMPSMKDWEMIVFGNYVERSGRVVCNDFWSLQIGTGFEDFHENYYWSSDEVEDHGEKKFRVMTFRFEGEDMIADFGMGSHYPNQKHIVRAVLAHNM